ncbi:hypothetical protein [Nonomuraea dietziae]|uniref:hypothetical protein n=1 Tax=Nonomuraea dietziae TaxID=65515 RepID=UPI00343D753E
MTRWTRVRASSAIAAEWIKLRTLRSTWWALGDGVVVSPALTGFGAATALQLIEQAPDIMPAWTAFAVLAGWAVLPLAAGVARTGVRSS